MSENARSFWDARAEEDAPFFVDNRLGYGKRDYSGLFARSEEALSTYEELLGVEFADLGCVLEIGCGLGRAARVLAARAQRVVALDVSQRMLDQARELNPELDNVRWLLGDGASLAGVEDRSIDVCFSHVVFQHIPDPRVTLGYVAEMGRVLREGGWAAFQISNDPLVHQPEWAPGATSNPYWIGSAVELPELRRVAAQAGLEIRRVVGAGTQFCLVHAQLA